jgi:N-methylhydantoinase A
VLGRLGRTGFAGGGELDIELAARSIEMEVAGPLGLTLEAAAEGIIKVVNANMVRAIRVVSVEKGYDPREFTLAAFGGAGPLHAVELARELGIPRVVVPRYPGVTSAWGMLAADVRRDYSLTHVAALIPEAYAEIAAHLEQLVRRAENDLARDGFDKERMGLFKRVDVRYKGQSYELTLPFPDVWPGEAAVNSMAEIFHDLHHRQYGYRRDGAALEVVTLRLAATGKFPEFSPAAGTGAGFGSGAGGRWVYFSGSYAYVPVFERQRISEGWEVEGPAVVSQDDSTTLVWPGDRVWCDCRGNLIIETVVRR